MEVPKEAPGPSGPAMVAGATALFAKVGVDATSMRDNIEATDVRRAEIYRRFVDDEQMAQAILAGCYVWHGRRPPDRGRKAPRAGRSCAPWSTWIRNRAVPPAEVSAFL